MKESAEPGRTLTVAALTTSTETGLPRNSAGTVMEAAKILGVHPNYLHRLIRNMGLSLRWRNNCD